MINVMPWRKAAGTNPHRPGLQHNETRTAFLFLTPNIIGFLLFSLLPVGATLVISLLSWDLIRDPEFVGLRNYSTLLTKDPIFREVMFNTGYYVVGVVPASIVLSLLLALAMNNGLKGISLFRAIFFIPVITSSVAVAMLWRWLYNTDYGLINVTLYSMGLPVIPWLSSTQWAMPAVIIMAIWKGLGYNMVIYLAGLQGISPTLYEAAAIDGAGGWARFRDITLPLLGPTTFFILVISIINSFQVFDLTFILTQGGPGIATTTIVMYIYDQGFRYFQMGYAAAIAWVLFIIIFIVTLIQMQFQKRWVHYD
ncbi:MAG TPA: sugar ABC transporter permease [Thermomicrobiales bacterium]|nr:sugar ABC transporter permease [Thermomicrobiales bacterium]